MENPTEVPAARGVSAILREMRTELGLSGKVVADRLKVPQSYVSRWETSRVPGLEDLFLIETVGLGVAPGTALRAAGFVGPGPQGRTVREAIETDPKLRGKARAAVLGAYDAAAAAAG